MNRRAFLTSLSAIPAVALFPALLRAEPQQDAATVYQDQLHQFMWQMRWQGDMPDAFFVTPDVMTKLAEAFSRTHSIKVEYNEFECPWGFDIVGTPYVEEGHIDVACKDSGVLYFFEWGSQAHVRKDPKELNAEWAKWGYFGHMKPHFLELPQR